VAPEFEVIPRHAAANQSGGGQVKTIYIAMVLLLLTACFRVTDADGNSLYLNKEAKLEGIGVPAQVTTTVKLPAQTLKAQVKGSIYGEGEMMSVFGTCLNATDEAFTEGTWAVLNAWYPNGTIYVVNSTMWELDQPGYFIYSSQMSAVQGTYLTEMVCHLNNTAEFAKAWGEWQNPYWVRRIKDINDSMAGVAGNLSLLNNKTDNLTLAIGNLSWNVSESFEITWNKMNQTDVLINNSYTNLTQQITYATMVANASVDRNDSYLASLIMQLANWQQLPQTHNLTWTEYPDDDFIYNKIWNIDVHVKNEYNVTIGYPLVSCFISTTNDPPVTNQLMSAAVATGNTHFSDGTAHFTFSERIRTMGDYSWTINCIYN
jgi:hypothetical protein